MYKRTLAIGKVYKRMLAPGNARHSSCPELGRSKNFIGRIFSTR